MTPEASTLKRWRKQPLAFVRECLKAEPDEWQADVLNAFPTHQRIAMKACKGPGKSTIESWLSWNFLATRPHPKVVATSITGDNLKDGLWAEMSKWQQRSPFLAEAFTWNAERIINNRNPETWFMSARTWSTGADSSQQANTLAGIHADYVMFVLDECGGIPDAVMAAAEGGLSTGIETKLVIGGNPTHLEGPLYRACTRERALWFVVEVTGDPDDPKRSPRISVQWAREQIAKYGRDNPWVLVNVFGKFPPGQSNALISADLANEATQRKLAERDYHQDPKILGVDVARFGDDRSVIFLRQGRAAFTPTVLRNLDTPQLVGQIVRAIEQHLPDATFVDNASWGASTVDYLRQLGHQALAVDFGGPPMEGKYANRRAEMWLKMSEWLTAGGAIPDDPELVGELTAPTYGFNEHGKLLMEKKKDIKKRTGSSPDKADALALTFAMPVAHRDLRRLQNASRMGTLHDYNPISR